VPPASVRQGGVHGAEAPALPAPAGQTDDLDLEELLRLLGSDLTALIRLIGEQSRKADISSAIVDLTARGQDRIEVLQEQIRRLMDSLNALQAAALAAAAGGNDAVAVRTPNGAGSALNQLQGEYFPGRLFGRLLRDLGVDEKMADAAGLTLVVVVLLLPGALSGTPALTREGGAGLNPGDEEAMLKMRTLLEQLKAVMEHAAFSEALEEEARAIAALLEKMLADLAGAVRHLAGGDAAARLPGLAGPA
jgi:uncharacterized coiled-coil protein SlyX